MKRLILYLTFFLIPVLFVCIINAIVVSPVCYTHRVWDGLSTTINKTYAFYPNYKIEMDEIGDLGFRTSKSILKHVVWKTDIMGFRNDSVITNPDVLIIGDSFVAGGALSQEQTISNVLAKFMPMQKIYAMAPSSFSHFLSYYYSGKIKKPKLIILFCVERFINEKMDTILDKELYENLKGNRGFTKFDETIDRFYKGADRLAFSSFFHQRTGIGIPSKKRSDFLFFEGEKSICLYNEKLINASENAKRINAKCKSLGVKFMFIPMPNKESVYWEYVPYSKQPDLLYKVDSALVKNNIMTINALDVLIQAKSNKKLLYHLDDTHWNSNGVSVVAQKVKQVIDSLKLL